jgi:hypothetical protein
MFEPNEEIFNQFLNQHETVPQLMNITKDQMKAIKMIAKACDVDEADVPAILIQVALNDASEEMIQKMAAMN